MQSYKNTTSVLLDQHGKFVDFGFDALDKYISSALEDEDTPDVTYRLFRIFEMVLHKTGVNEKFVILRTICAV